MCVGNEEVLGKKAPGAGRNGTSVSEVTGSWG